jgi:hypothetical protein
VPIAGAKSRHPHETHQPAHVRSAGAQPALS